MNNNSGNVVLEVTKRDLHDKNMSGKGTIWAAAVGGRLARVARVAGQRASSARPRALFRVQGLVFLGGFFGR